MSDVVYFVDKGHLFKDVENDGAAFLKRGPERYTEYLGTVEEAKIKYPQELARALRGTENAVQ